MGPSPGPPSRASVLLDKMSLRRYSKLVAPPALPTPVYEEKALVLSRNDTKPIVGLWHVGPSSSQSDVSNTPPVTSNLKLLTRKGAIDAHLVITGRTCDNRPNVDVKSTTGPITVKLTRTENSRFNLKVQSNSGTVLVILPQNFRGAIIYRARHLAIFSARAARVRGSIMTSAPVGCDGDVDCDNTMEVAYSDRPMNSDEIPEDCDVVDVSTIRGRIHFLVAGENPPALGGVWDILKTTLGFGRTLPSTIKCQS